MVRMNAATSNLANAGSVYQHRRGAPIAFRIIPCGVFRGRGSSIARGWALGLAGVASGGLMRVGNRCDQTANDHRRPHPLAR